MKYYCYSNNEDKIMCSRTFLSLLMALEDFSITDYIFLAKNNFSEDFYLSFLIYYANFHHGKHSIIFCEPPQKIYYNYDIEEFEVLTDEQAIEKDNKEWIIKATLIE